MKDSALSRVAQVARALCMRQPGHDAHKTLLPPRHEGLVYGSYAHGYMTSS